MLSKNLFMEVPFHGFFLTSLLLSSFHVLLTHSSSLLPSLCHHHEQSALLQFKDSFLIDKSSSEDPAAYPKTESWGLKGKHHDCCSWDGIECDKRTGYVIGLNLSSSFLHGSINSTSSLFHLIHLRRLNLGDNNFSNSEIPPRFMNFSRLSSLILPSASLSGRISFLANMTQLTYLDLDSNNFSPFTMSCLAKLTKLAVLDLSYTSLYGGIPSFIRNFTQLKYFYANVNLLTGRIPYWIGNHTQLIGLDLSENELDGPFPESIFQLANIEFLILAYNHLTGTLEFDWFLKMKKLSQLHLSSNNLSVFFNPLSNVSLPKFQLLRLGTCNLTEFPEFLRDQDELEYLALEHNMIHGQIPGWLLNISKDTLRYLDLDSNFLTGFEQPQTVLPWNNLLVLRLGSNKLQGSLPIPSPSILAYDISNNLLTGKVPSLVCKLTSILAIDFSDNKLSGTLPQCLGKFTNSLWILNLRNNNFSGSIPQTCTRKSQLKMIDFSQNRLHGHVQKSLADCTMLQSLNLGENRLKGSFPSWLGALPDLRVLIMQSNKFHGAIGKPQTNYSFPKLHILDLSHNRFEGKLPSGFFQFFTSMKLPNENHLAYLEVNGSLTISNILWFTDYNFSMLMTNKGTKREYERILDFFIAIDLSGNKFEGEIPEGIGDLKALHLLNISNNILSGQIPLTLGSLTKLESLDLSQNKLSGGIPQQLTQLTFLEFFNVSHNNLTGRIPQGTQFDTFENNSYDGNPGLCGKPLSKKCEIGAVLKPSISEESEESESVFHFGWKVVLMGYGSGFWIGICIGHGFTTMKKDWLIRTFGQRRRQRRRGRRGQRN